MGRVTSGNEPSKRRSLNSVDLRARRIDELNMRIEGHTYREICAKHGVGHSVVLKDIEAMLAERDGGNIQLMRELEAERLDAATTRVMQIIGDSKAGTEVVLKAIDRLARIVGRRARLFGLDAPVKVEVETLEVTQADLELQELIREAKARNSATREQIVDSTADDA